MPRSQLPWHHSRDRVSLHDRLRIDEPALRKLASWLAGHEGVVAVMTNGHTGEVFSLTPAERAEVTRIVAEELKGACR